MKRPASLLLAALAVSACDGGRRGAPAAFDEAMRRLQERGEGRGALPTVAGGAAVLPEAPLPAGTAAAAARAPARREVVDLGLRGGAGPARSPGPPGAVPAGGGTVTLNFVDAPVPQVVQAVLGDLLRLDYTLDPRVSGTVTLQTQRPVRQEAALSLLESALEVNGAALVAGSGGYRVVPLDEALKSGPPVGLRAAGARPAPGFAIVALPIANAKASELQRVLQPLVPRGGAVIADEARNVLLVAGSGAQIATLIDAAESFDVDWLRGQSLALVPLENAPAAQVAQEIATAFNAEGAGALRAMPIGRMNAVLLVAAQPQQLARAQRWARQLDTGGQGASPQLFVHRVQYVRATDLANTLRQLLQGGGGGRGGAAVPLLAPGVPGAVAAGGAVAAAAPGMSAPPPGMVAGGAALTTPGGAPLPAGAAVPAGAAGPPTAGGMVPLAPEGAPGFPPGFGNGGGAGGGPPYPGNGAEPGGLPPAPIRVVADEAQNALIVYASPTDWRFVERAILVLDRPPNQVAIDAVIAEVALNDDLEYGLSWFFRSGVFEFSNTTSLGGAPAPVFPGFNLLYSGNADARVVLRALANITDVRVISSPQVMVLSNQTARLRVGDSVPIVTQQAIGTATSDARIINSVQLRDTGVSLDVTPRVNAAGGVLLEVDQDVSDAVRTTTSGIDSPTIQQRRLRSMVAVPTGETVALGGLIREADTRNRTGLPFVQDVPVLRELMGVTARNRRRTELLVLLTPRVVQTAEDMRRVTEELRLRMHSMRPRDDAPPPLRRVDAPQPAPPPRRAFAPP